MGASRVSDLRLAGRVWIEALYSYILPHCTIVALDLESCIHVILILPFKCKSHQCHRVGSKNIFKEESVCNCTDRWNTRAQQPLWGSLGLWWVREVDKLVHRLWECTAGLNFYCSWWNVVREKHCSGWENKPNKPEFSPAEHSHSMAQSQPHGCHLRTHIRQNMAQTPFRL